MYPKPLTKRQAHKCRVGNILHIVEKPKYCKGHIEKVLVVGAASVGLTKAWFMRVVPVGCDEYTKPYLISLRDVGVIPNNYNKTKTFVYKHSAKRYLERLRRES